MEETKDKQGGPESSSLVPDIDLEMQPQFTDFREVARTAHALLICAHRYGHRYVLKTLLPEEASQKAYQMMLYKEAKLMGQLDHPHIIHTYGLERVPGIGSSAEHVGYLEMCRVYNNNRQGKAFYRRAEGKYAIRAPSAPTETYTTYWGVYDIDDDGRPEVDYSVKRNYVWQLAPIR